MGMSAHATIAWGVNLGDGEFEEVSQEVAEKIERLLDHDWDLEEFFGFSEPCPTGPGVREGPEFDAWKVARDAWAARKDAAIPVEFDHYGSYDYGGKALVVKRTQTRVNWGLTVVDLDTLAHSSMPHDPKLWDHEVAALNKVLDAIGFQGDRTPKLLLFAMYG